MKFRKSFKAVALVLGIIMLLGLTACGGGSGSQPQGGGQVHQPQVNEPDVQSRPTVTNPPVSTAGITGIWVDGPVVLTIYSDFAFLYEFGSGSEGSLRFGYLKNLYDCSYTLSGNTLSLSAYEIDGTPVHSGEYTLEGNTLRDEYNEFVKVSNNVGTEGELGGNWIALGDEFRLGDSSVTGDDFSGTQMRFYNDGTCAASWDDGSGLDAGRYFLTSMYDLPAITLFDDHGYELGTYPYEFLSNDLLMIYVYDVDFGGYVFYRVS